MRKFIFMLGAFIALSFGVQYSAEVKTFHAENFYLIDKGERFATVANLKTTANIMKL